MSAADIANRHFTAALTDAKAERRGYRRTLPLATPDRLHLSGNTERGRRAVGIALCRRQLRSRHGLRLHATVARNAPLTPPRVGAILTRVRGFVLNGVRAIQNKM